MEITIDIAEVTCDTGGTIGSTVRLNEDQIEVAAFKTATELVTLLRTRFAANDRVFVTVNASTEP